MKPEPFCAVDIADFLSLAEQENWVAEPWELEFLLDAFPEGCLVVRDEDGLVTGCVTSLLHHRSGWIGNLIVEPKHRGKGLGETLFLAAMGALQAAEAETIWLTASKMGISLYEKHGFNRIDTIVRWRGNGRQRFTGQETEATGVTAYSALNDIDSRAWGDRRDALLAVTSGRGRVLQQEAGFVVLQKCGNDRQLGPYCAAGYGAADALLKMALNSIPFGTKVRLDAPASNRTALQLFNRNRFRITGSNELMYAGVKPAYQPEYIYGLATMGSCG